MWREIAHLWREIAPSTNDRISVSRGGGGGSRARACARLRALFQAGPSAESLRAACVLGLMPGPAAHLASNWEVIPVARTRGGARRDAPCRDRC
jgi:hypothetical protein